MATGTANPPVRYQYGYVDKGNGEASSGYAYLGSISVPSPTGTGMATSTIDYDQTYATVKSITDANGNKREYSATDWNGTADANKTTVKVKDPVGNLVQQYTVGFDGAMNATVRKNAQGQAVSTPAYGSGGAMYHGSSTTDGNGRVWSATYDQYGNPLTTTTPKGTTTTCTYDYANFALGELTSVKQGTKTTINLTYYEPSGLLHEVLSPIPGESGTGNVQVQTFWYDALGNLTHIAAPASGGTSLRHSYLGYTADGSYSQAEAVGRPITVTDALGKVTHLRYDARGNLASVTDPLGNQTQLTHNLADQVTGTSVPATGNTGSGRSYTQNAYLYVGGPATQSKLYDESGILRRTISTTYGPEGETLATGGNSESVSYSYNAAYRIKALSDGGAHATTYAFDLNGRPTQIAYPGATGANYDKVLLTSYDPVGNLLSRTDGNGTVTNFTYGDANGLLSAVSYPGAAANSIAITYDAYGRPKDLTDATGSATTNYDDDGRVTSSTRTYTGLTAKTFTYSFWPDGSRKTMVTPAGTWTYGYDSDGRYTSLVSPSGTASTTYLDNGWAASRTLPNGVSTIYSRNAVGALTGLLNQTAGASTVSQYGSFAYDATFNLSGLAASIPGAATQGGTTTYGYDALDRLTGETSGRLGGYSQTHAYDAAGNPTTFKGTTQGFDADNRQTLGGGAFVYDGNGNPTTYKGMALGFDPGNRPSSIGSAFTAGYRADGLRGWKSVSGTKTYYLYDGTAPILELNAAGAVTAVNVFAPDGLVARQQSGVWTQYVFDPQGSVAQRLNSTGTVQSSSVYDAYGTESNAGAAPNDAFGFNAQNGYVFDRETGLYLCGHRYYAPAAGRWITRDPIGALGGTNLYGYCQGRPVGWADPSGFLCRDSVTCMCERFPRWCMALGAEIGMGGTGAAILGNSNLQTSEEGLEEASGAISTALGNGGSGIMNVGNAAHQVIQDLFTQDPAWQQEVNCTAGRMDLYNQAENLIIEIKPGTWNGIGQGVSQLGGYTGAMGGSGQVIFYPAPWAWGWGGPEGLPLFPPGFYN